MWQVLPPSIATNAHSHTPVLNMATIMRTLPLCLYQRVRCYESFYFIEKTDHWTQ
jgi:hypothetical protein